MKAKWLERYQKLLCYLRHHGSTIKIFSDKKIFTVDQVVAEVLIPLLVVATTPRSSAGAHPKVLGGMDEPDGAHIDPNDLANVLFAHLGMEEIGNPLPFYFLLRVQSEANWAFNGRCTAFSYLENDPDLSFFAVYDGHGGTGVANYLKDHLHEFILDQVEYKEGNMEEAILKAFLQVDQDLRTYGSATELTGSTAVVVMIKHGELYCANLGDSRATACVRGLVKALTCDHNTSNAKERERVYAMGGNIKENRVGGVLIPTRCFGDFLLKSEIEKPAWKQVISAVPQIVSFKLSSNWDFVVVGSDGVWDAMSNQDMVTYVKTKLSAMCASQSSRDKVVLSSLCEEILDHCCAKTVERYGKNSCDNMTIIIIWLDQSDHRSETGSSVVSSVASR
eukprot:maker-scaffold302_size216161-snap-gene-1.13 protein:Tk02611 transcript:maker-scaffold302_size216161-snap-gene-1.13-mRNA-1 annotation:"probable protein phosphatase 2c"